MTPATTAREYLRVSQVVKGNDRSPEEQHADNKRAADRLGWTVGEPYRDKVSASRYSQKVREDFQRLIADLEADRFAASVLILWESSRGSRQMSEWVRLLELLEARSVRIFVTSDGKLYDPTDARDRRSLLEDAVDAEFESAKTSKRVARAAAASAAAGRPGPGWAPFGYRRVYDPTTGKMAGQEIDPAEAAAIRRLFDRLQAGDSLRAIADEFTARGWFKRDGKPFTRTTLRILALNRAYIGERVHDPDGRRTPQGRLSPRATVTQGTWAPIVDRAQWTAVHRMLTDPERTTTRPARGVHWLTHIVLCDACSGPIQARLRNELVTPEWMYFCHAATHVRVPYEALNEYAEAVLLAYLAREDIADRLTAQPVDLGAVAAAEAEIATVEQEIDDLADQLATGGPAARKILERSLPRIEARLASAKARKDELMAPSRLRGLIQPGKDVARRWKVTPMPARREIARLLFAPDLIGELRVTKGPLRNPIEQRVSWRRS